MKQDFAFGGIVFKKDGDNWKVLLAKKPQFTSWDLPKGHKDGEESDVNTALREVNEETGYKNIKLSGEKVSVSYEVEKNGEKIFKTVTFFLGEHEGDEKPEQKLDNDEDESGGVEIKWTSLVEAVELLTFAPFKSALKQAIEKWNKQLV